MIQADDLSEPLDDVEFEELDDFLLSVEHDEAMLNMSEFDGFITAVVSGPEMIMPSTWVPAVWGGEENAPEWTSMEDYQLVFGLMIRHLNTTAATLMQQPAKFEPCFMESKVKGVTHWVVDEWCLGYMKGVVLYPDGIETSPDMKEMLIPIRRFAFPDGWDSIKGKDHREIRQLQEQIAPAARAIHSYWLAKRSAPASQSATFIRPEAKVGRNDPCPCGSGRKYKKCCGTH